MFGVSNFQEWKKQSRGDGDYKLDSLGRCLADIQNEVEKILVA